MVCKISYHKDIYYRRLQEELRQNKNEKKAQKSQEQQNIPINQDKYVTKTQKVQEAAAIAKLQAIKDQVDISSKAKTEKSETLDKGDSEKANNSVLMKNYETDGLKILKFLGFKIDLSSKVGDLVEAFMRNTVQGRSHNFFLAKYAQFKLGIIGQILSMVGVNQEELVKLQKKALEGAADENIKLMGENLYNLELTELVYGRSRKVKRSLAMFREVESQLIVQMNLLGKTGYWSKVKLLEARIKQCTRIKNELQRERDTLDYQCQFITQEKIGGSNG